MLIEKNITIYVIAGWGFSPKVFTVLSTTDLTVIGLEYLTTSLTTLESIAAHLSKVLPENSILLGWSFGGLIAIQIASLFPNKVKKLILISSQAKFLSEAGWDGIEPGDADNFIKSFKNNREKQTDKFISLINYPNRCLSNRHFLLENFLHLDFSYLLKLLYVLFNTDLREEYQTIPSKIFYILNKQDAILRQNENQLKSLKHNAKIISLDNAGHAAFLVYPSIYQNILKNICLL